MEQMYLIEVLIDKVTLFLSEDEGQEATNKNLIIKVQWGPKLQFIIKEGLLAKQDRSDSIEEQEGIKKWTRSIRVGKSYLFPSYADTMLMLISKFPLMLEIWNDDEKEVKILIGVGTMLWDTEFYLLLKDASHSTKKCDPLTIKQDLAIYNECCCEQVGVISFILRLSVLGDSLLTDFQQLMKDPDQFIFQTDRAPSKFQCKRIEPDDTAYNTKNTLYENTLEEDPEVIERNKPTTQICTELQSCGMASGAKHYTCEHGTGKTDDEKKIPLQMDKIRLGDIIGPCGNANCTLAHKVKNYIRKLESYKKEYEFGAVKDTKNMTRKVCGTCSCKDDRYHKEECKDLPPKATCGGCKGTVIAGDSCKDRKNKHFDTGLTPRHSPTKVACLFNITRDPYFKESNYNREFISDNLNPKISYSRSQGTTVKTSETGYYSSKTVCNVRSSSIFRTFEDKKLTRNIGTNDNFVNNTPMQNKNFVVYNAYTSCTEPPNSNDCTCNPPKPTPVCKTFDCDCISEMVNITARKNHKSYCPLYKHKANCPVTMSLEEENLEDVDAEDKTEPLPYGLPPVRLGPCPILGRPCTVPDGFARMYRNAVQPPLPPSHSDAGKVCCSKEYWRIKKALKEYLKNHKDDDFRCLNRFNVDTERRCCDKEQALFELMGRGCCGQHKLSIQDQYKEK